MPQPYRQPTISSDSNRNQSPESEIELSRVDYHWDADAGPVP